MPPLHADVLLALDERSEQQVTDQMVRSMALAGTRAGAELGRGIQDGMRQELSRINSSMDQLGSQMQSGFTRFGQQSGRSFGGSFTSELAQSLPGVSGFASAMSGYDTAAGKVGAAAGRAMGLAFTTAAAGLIGAAGYTLFKGFERYEAIDAATNRLENLNRTMEATGRAGIDVQSVMAVVNQSVMDTPFALDQAFSVATRALASNTGDLQRFMGVVTDAAGFAGAGVDEIGEAFLKIANSGKVSMEEIGNELRNIPILPWLQEQLGVTGSDLSKMISDGKVGLEDLMRAVETNAAGFAKSSGDTVAGAMANAQTAVARIGANLLGAVFGKPAEDGNNLVEVLQTVRERLDDVNAWVTAHQDDIRRVFEDGARVAGDLASTVMSIVDALDDMGIGVDDVVKAFVAWQAIQGVTSLTNSLATIGTTLSTNLPDSANKGAAGISGALSRVAVPAWLAFLVAANGPEIEQQIATSIPGGEAFNNAPNPGDAGKAARDWWDRNVQGQQSPPDTQTGPAGPNFGSGSGSNSIGGIPMPGLIDAGSVPSVPFGPSPGQSTIPVGVEDRRGRNGSGPSIPDGPRPAGGDILPPPGADGSSGGSGPRLPPAPGVPYAELPAIDPRLQMTAGLFSAQTSVADARTRLAEKEARVRQLEATNEATADEIMNAKADRAKAEREATEADLRFTEAQQKAFEEQFKQSKKLNDGMGEIGAALDNDFGISDGLPGIADNLVRFVASLAAAPLLGQLSAVAQANPSQGGYGILGIAGAQGAFGPNFTGIDYGQSASVLGPTALQPGMATGVPLGASGAPSEEQVKQIAASFGLQVTSEDRAGDPGYHGRGMALDLSNGSGNTQQQRAFAEYMSANFGPYLKELIYSDGSFSGNIGDGKNVSGTGYYSQDTLSDHKDHVHVAADWGNAASGGGPVPVSVVNAPSGSGFPWDTVAKYESSGNWQNADTGGNGHYGGLQFSPSTWNAFGGQEFAPMPHMATREQQMAIADRTAFTGYNGVAPQGLGAWEVITNGSAAADGITTASRPPVDALSQPLGMPGTGGPGLAGAPTSAPFLPGPSPVFGPQGAAGGAGASTALGSQQMAATPGGGGIGLGGGAMDALMGAAGAADLLMPGAGQAAQVGMKLINRGIQYGGQLAGIGVSGILQTLIPSGDNPASNIGNSWLGKLAGGIAGARPALPNQAGKSAPPPQQADPNTKQHGQAAGQAPGPTNGLYIDKFYGSQRDYETAAEMNRHAQHNQYTGVRR